MCSLTGKRGELGDLAEQSYIGNNRKKQLSDAIADQL